MRLVRREERSSGSTSGMFGGVERVVERSAKVQLAERNA